MKLKKNYRFDNKRQIWRIIPTDDGKLVIEERETENKLAYFHCLELESGKKILSNFQPEDKFWVGVEAVLGDIIFFHKFAKPDMPKHRGIFAFDLMNREFIWKDNILMLSFHEANSKGTLNNLFKAVDLSEGKYILEKVINKETGLFLTDSYFVKDNLLFLLFGKTRLEVYKIIY